MSTTMVSNAFLFLLSLCIFFISSALTLPVVSSAAAPYVFLNNGCTAVTTSISNTDNGYVTCPTILGVPTVMIEGHAGCDSGGGLVASTPVDAGNGNIGWHAMCLFATSGAISNVRYPATVSITTTCCPFDSSWASDSTGYGAPCIAAGPILQSNRILTSGGADCKYTGGVLRSFFAQHTPSFIVSNGPSSFVGNGNYGISANVADRSWATLCGYFASETFTFNGIVGTQWSVQEVGIGLQFTIQCRSDMVKSLVEGGQNYYSDAVVAQTSDQSVLLGPGGTIQSAAYLQEAVFITNELPYQSPFSLSYYRHTAQIYCPIPPTFHYSALHIDSFSVAGPISHGTSFYATCSAGYTYLLQATSKPTIYCYFSTPANLFSGCTPQLCGLWSDPHGTWSAGAVLQFGSTTTLTCNTGYVVNSPINSAQCGVGGSRQAVVPSGIPFCVGFTVASLSVTPNSNYQMTLQWTSLQTPALQNPVSFLISYVRNYPGFSTVEQSANPASLSGILPNNNLLAVVPFVSGQSVYTYSITVDSLSQINGISGTISVTPNLSGFPNTSPAGQPNTANFRLPCGCTYSTSAGSTDIDGLPQSFQLIQNVNTNTISVFFTPNSLCAFQYVVSIYSPSQTYAVVNSSISTFKMTSAFSCQFRSPQTATVTFVDASIIVPGITYKYTISSLPEAICPTCVTYYSAQGGIVSSSQLFAANFSFFINGVVSTPVSLANPASVGINNIGVRIDIYDNSDVSFANSLWNQNFLTDNTGAYVGSMSVSGLSNNIYWAKVTPFKTEILNNGSTFAHQFVSAQNTSLSNFFIKVTHNRIIPGIGFYDTSQVEVSGTVLLNFASVYSNAFTSNQPVGSGNCGIPNIVIQAILSNGGALVSMSQPTGNDGAWSLAVPIFSSITLTPSYSNSATISNIVPHTFSPTSVSIAVGVAPIVISPFNDITTAVLNISFVGGIQRMKIGAIRPYLTFSSCANQNPVYNTIPLDLAGDSGVTGYLSGTTSYIVPAQQFLVSFPSPSYFLPQQSLSPTPPAALPGFQPPSSASGNTFFTCTTAIPPVCTSPVKAADKYYSSAFSDAAAWALTIQSVNMNLLNLTGEIDLTYYAPPLATIGVFPQSSSCAAHNPTPAFYSVNKLANITLSFLVTETYGPSSIWDSTKKYFSTQSNVNTQVIGNVNFQDGLTNAGDVLTVSGGTCDSLARVCGVPMQYDPIAKLTWANYTLTVGEVEISAPYFRNFHYYAVGSNASLSVNTQADTIVNVAVLGTLTYPASIFFPYPPGQPLYILREPPGSHSYAKLSTGTQLTTSLSFKESLSTDSGIQFRLTSWDSAKSEECVGLGVSACIQTINTDVRAGNQLNAGTTSLTGLEQAAQFVYSFEQDVMTSARRQKTGDLYLCISTTVQVQPSITIALNSSTCSVSSTSHFTWSLDDKQTLEWIDEYSINNVIIPDMQNVLASKLVDVGYPSLAALQAAYPSITHPTAEETDAITLGAAISDWQAMLNWNLYLESQATEFVDFYQHLSGPSNYKSTWQTAHTNPYNDPAVATYIANPPALPNHPGNAASLEPINRDSLSYEAQPNGEPLDSSYNIANDILTVLSLPFTLPVIGVATQIADTIVQVATSPTMANDRSPQQNMVADTTLGSMAFWGGGSSITMKLKTSNENEEDNESEGGATVGKGDSVNTFLDFFGIGIILAGKSFLTIGVDHSYKQKRDSIFTNEVDIYLQDKDFGDEFKFQILKDPIYGAPVYRIMAGKSRCICETNTLCRESLEVSFSTSVIQNVYPDQPAATYLNLNNVSPTSENFIYSITIDETTNLLGLTFSINGKILSSDTNAFQVMLTYGQPLSLVLEARRSTTSLYEFPDVKVIVSSVIDDSQDSDQPLVCYSASAFLSVSFISPCNQVQFVGSYVPAATFMLGISELPSGSQYIPLTIYNPQSSIPWFKWYQNAASTKLHSIDLEYRPVNGNDNVWIPLSDFDTKTNVNVVLPTTSSSPLNQDFASVKWDLTSISHGEFYIRSRTVCQVVSATDPTLNGFTSDYLHGIIDQVSPNVFGYPVPNVFEEWIPGTEISATFTETISCGDIQAYWFLSPNGSVPTNPLPYPTALEQTQEGPISVLQPAYTICSETGTTVYVTFAAPNLNVMGGRVVSIVLIDVADIVGNPVVYENEPFVQWSFYVANINNLNVFISGYSTAGQASNISSSTEITFENNVLAMLSSQSASSALLQNEIVSILNEVQSINTTVTATKVSTTAIQSTVLSTAAAVSTIQMLVTSLGTTDTSILSYVKSILNDTQRTLTSLSSIQDVLGNSNSSDQTSILQRLSDLQSQMNQSFSSLADQLGGGNSSYLSSIAATVNQLAQDSMIQSTMVSLLGNNTNEIYQFLQYFAPSSDFQSSQLQFIIQQLQWQTLSSTGSSTLPQYNYLPNLSSFHDHNLLWLDYSLGFDTNILSYNYTSVSIAPSSPPLSPTSGLVLSTSVGGKSYGNFFNHSTFDILTSAFTISLSVNHSLNNLNPINSANQYGFSLVFSDSIPTNGTAVAGGISTITGGNSVVIRFLYGSSQSSILSTVTPEYNNVIGSPSNVPTLAADLLGQDTFTIQFDPTQPNQLNVVVNGSPTITVSLAVNLQTQFANGCHFGIVSGSAPGTINGGSLQILSLVVQLADGTYGSDLPEANYWRTNRPYPAGSSYSGRQGAASVYSQANTLIFMIGGEQCTEPTDRSSCQAIHDVNVYDGNDDSRWYSIPQVGSVLPTPSTNSYLSTIQQPFHQEFLVLFTGQASDGTNNFGCFISPAYNNGNPSTIGSTWDSVTMIGAPYISVYPPMWTSDTIGFTYFMDHSGNVWTVTMALQTVPSYSVTATFSLNPPVSPSSALPYTNLFGSIALCENANSRMYLIPESYDECPGCGPGGQQWISYFSGSVDWNVVPVVKNFIPRKGGRLVSARYLYFPSSALFYMGGSGLADVWAFNPTYTALTTSVQWELQPAFVPFRFSQDAPFPQPVWNPTMSSIIIAGYSPLATEGNVFIACIRADPSSCPSPLVSHMGPLAINALLTETTGTFTAMGNRRLLGVGETNVNANASPIQKLINLLESGVRIDENKYPLLSQIKCSPISVTSNSIKSIKKFDCSQVAKSSYHFVVESIAHQRLSSDSSNENVNDIHYMRIGDRPLALTTAMESSLFDNHDDIIHFVDMNSAISKNNFHVSSKFQQKSSDLTVRLPAFEGNFTSHSEMIYSTLLVSFTVQAKGSNMASKLSSSQWKISLNLLLNIAHSDDTFINSLLSVSDDLLRSKFAFSRTSSSLIDFLVTSTYDPLHSTSTISMSIPRVPTLIGGAEYEVFISRNDVSEIAFRCFVTGPPSSPLVIGNSQGSDRTVKIDFIPSIHNGLHSWDEKKWESDNEDSSDSLVQSVAYWHPSPSHPYVRIPAAAMSIEKSTSSISHAKSLLINLNVLDDILNSTANHIPLNKNMLFANGRTLDIALQSQTFVSSSALSPISIAIVPSPPQSQNMTISIISPSTYSVSWSFFSSHCDEKNFPKFQLNFKVLSLGKNNNLGMERSINMDDEDIIISAPFFDVSTCKMNATEFSISSSVNLTIPCLKVQTPLLSLTSEMSSPSYTLSSSLLFMRFSIDIEAKSSVGEQSKKSSFSIGIPPLFPFMNQFEKMFTMTMDSSLSSSLANMVISPSSFPITTLLPSASSSLLDEFSKLFVKYFMGIEIQWKSAESVDTMGILSFPFSKMVKQSHPLSSSFSSALPLCSFSSPLSQLPTTDKDISLSFQYRSLVSTTSNVAKILQNQNSSSLISSWSEVKITVSPKQMAQIKKSLSSC